MVGGSTFCQKLVKTMIVFSSNSNGDLKNRHFFEIFVKNHHLGGSVPDVGFFSKSQNI
jgi:hypothetical protein